VALTVDGMGKRIDIGIMGVVLYLNLHGVSTTASCEGHLDHGHPYPWVWVPEADMDALNALLSAFYPMHTPADDRILVMECDLVEDEVILRPLGADKQDSRADDERTRKLAEYQREMQCFAEFLRDKFFESWSGRQ
jgi:hypothetical protein